MIELLQKIAEQLEQGEVIAASVLARELEATRTLPAEELEEARRLVALCQDLARSRASLIGAEIERAGLSRRASAAYRR